MLAPVAQAADGFGKNATGGAGGKTVTVTTAAEFKAAVEGKATDPLIIQVQGKIEFDVVRMKIGNKSIVGAGTKPTLSGNLMIAGATNVILQDLILTNPAEKTDTLTIIRGAKDVWVDHCTFIDGRDGQCDITRKADNVTVSWCKFSYTQSFGHNFSMLIGSSDSAADDLGTLHVTLHHNWFGELCDQRMPSVRFGRVHVYNNYYSAANNLYCIRSRIQGEVFVENNFFEKVKTPFEIFTTKKGTGLLKATGNKVVETLGETAPGTDEVFKPSYDYTPEPAESVKENVMKGAGCRL
jgi:pectate lyase